MSFAYHSSSHGLIFSRVGSGRSAAVNASSVIVIRRRGAKNHRLLMRMPMPLSSMTAMCCSLPS